MKHLFSKAVVLYCILMSTIITAAVLFISYRAGDGISSGTVTALMAFWGGELLLLCLKRIFGDSSGTEKSKTKPVQGEYESV